MKPIPQVPGEGAEPFVASGSWWGTGDTDALFLRHYFFRGSHAGILWFFVDKLTDTTWVQGVVD
jgi:hypothetical protein